MKFSKRHLRRGVVVRHHSGRVYTILGISIGKLPGEEPMPMVAYVGSNGKDWSRPVNDFLTGKFTVLFDGTKYAAANA